MSPNPNLFRPPPPPPRPASRPVDPLTALSKPALTPPAPPSEVAPAPVASVAASAVPTRMEPELLTDLSDEDMEMWAMGGTRIIPKVGDSTAPPPVTTGPVGPITTTPVTGMSAPPIPAALAETMKSGATPENGLPAFTPPPMMAAPMLAAPVLPPMAAPIAPTMMQSPSFPPLTMSASSPPPAMYDFPKKKSSLGLWLLVGSLTGLFGLGVVGAGAAYYFYEGREAAATELATAETAAEANQAPTATATTTAAPTQVQATAAATNAAATNAPTPTQNNAQGHQAQIAAPPAVVHSDSSTTSQDAQRSHQAAATETHTGGSGGSLLGDDNDSLTATGSSHGSHASASSAGASAAGSGGSIRTFAAGAGKALFIDGHLAGIGSTTPLKTSCGHHSIRVGEGKARSYEVPCNGSTLTVGTPDGT